MGDMWLRVCVAVVLLAAVAVRGEGDDASRDAVMREVCGNLQEFASHGDTFSFRHMEQWDAEATPNCCVWPGVQCGALLGSEQARNISRLFLAGVSGDGSSLRIPVSLERLHMEVDEKFVAMPQLGDCVVVSPTDECVHLRRLDITGPPSGPLPLVEVPDLTSVVVHEVSLSRLNLTSLDLRRLEQPNRPLFQRNAGVTLSNVHSRTPDVRRGWSTTMLDNVSGMRSFLPPDDAVTDATTITNCNDLVEVGVEWNLHKDGPVVPVLNIVGCAALTKLPRHVHGPGEVHFRDLPAAHFVPEFGGEVRSIHLEGLPPHIVQNMESRFSMQDSQLQDLSVVNCGLSSMFRIPSKVHALDLSHNNITSLEHFAYNHSVALQLYLSDNPIAHLPVSRSLPRLRELRCDRCLFSGRMDVGAYKLSALSLQGNHITHLYLAGSEVSVDVSNNDLEEIVFATGALPDQLRIYRAPHNRLRSVMGKEPLLGPLPTVLEELDMAHNELQVGVTKFSLPESLTKINLAFNNITLAPPIVHMGDDMDAVALHTYNISHNAVVDLNLDGVHSNTFAENTMVVVDVSHNQLHSWEQVQRLLLTASNLEEADVSGNRFSVAFTDADPIFRRKLPALKRLHLDDNPFTGPLRLHNMPALAEISVSRTGFRMEQSEECRARPRDQELKCLGDVVVGEMVDGGESDRCPQLAVRVAGERISTTGLDASYHSGLLCQCRFGFYRAAGDPKCARAPQDAICPGGASSQVVLPVQGHWRGGECDVVACVREFAPQCAPNTTLSSVFASADDLSNMPACADGYESRMCSACSHGYYRVGVQCRACPGTAVVDAATSVVVLVLIAGLLSVAYLLPRESDAMFKVSVIAVQMVALAGRVSVSLAPFLVDFVQVWALSLMNLPMYNGCVAPHSAFHDLEGSFVVLALSIGTPLLIYLVGGVYLATRRADPAARRNWADRNARAACILFWVAFQNFATVLPTYFQCEHDACLSTSFFMRMPFQTCNGRGAAMRNTSITMFTLVIVPLHVGALVWAVRTARGGGDTHKLRGLDFLVNGYNDTTNWWDAVLLAGRLLAGMCASLVIGDRVFSAFFVFAVLYLMYELHTNWQPFEAPGANWTISWVFFLHSMVFAACMASNTTLLAADIGFDSVVLLAQTATMALPIAFAVTVGGRDNRLQQLVRKRMWGDSEAL